MTTQTKLNEATIKIPEWNMVEDITIKQCKEFGLDIVPYFFDKDTAKRRKMEYVYLGRRMT